MRLGDSCLILEADGGCTANDEVKWMRILLADDQPSVRFALRVLLERQAGEEVVGEAADTEQLVTLAEATRPDLLLLDWELPGPAAIDLLAVLRGISPNLIVIALSGQPDARRAALLAGVDAFVSKGDPPEQLLAAIRAHSGVCRDGRNL